MANQQQSSGGLDHGGRATNPGNFANDRGRASEAGRKGGQNQGRATNPGNFANDRGRASEAGRKGGQHSRSRGGGGAMGEGAPG